MKDDSNEEGLLQGDVSDVRINAISARPTEIPKEEELKNKELPKTIIQLTPYRFIIVIV